MPSTPKRKTAPIPESPRSTKKARVAPEVETNSTAVTPRRSTRAKVTTKVESPASEEHAIVEEKVIKVKTVAPKKAKTSLASSAAVNGVKKEPKNVKVAPKVETVVKEAPKKASKKAKKPTQAKQEDTEEEREVDAEKPKRKRKTKEEKEAEMIPLAARTQGLKMFIGAHVSGAGGVHNGVTNAVHIGGNAFALFLKSQRKWDNPPLQDEHRSQFINLCKDHSYASDKHVLPHGSYLVNLAQKEADKAAQAYSSFIDDLKRCDALGIKLYNFHPGNTGPHPRNEAISRIAQAINKAHKETKAVIPVLETMAGGNNTIGSTFEDIRDAIAEISDKSRVGVCIDTCHIFAAGYDIRSPTAFKKTLEDFDRIIGMKYLKALHLNDSKAPFNSHRDLHQNIGQGFLGLRTFHNVMNEPRLEGLPMVLETPIDRKDEKGKAVEDKGIWAREIKLLESLIGMDAESEEFRKLESELSAKGEEERKRVQGQVDRKAEKDEKKVSGKGKGRKKKKGGEEDEDSEASD